MPTEVPPARPSSTVVLVRDADVDAPEFFMVRRPERASFGAAYVFPGGVVDATDADACRFCRGVDAAEADRRLRVDSGGLDYYVAAIRELFEETGVLMADTQLGEHDLAACRQQLNDTTLSWSAFITDAAAVLGADRLRYFSHWITPDALPKRYSTRFFLAELPAGQHAEHDPGELTDSRWMSANTALQAGRDGDIQLRYPTRKTLELLAEHDSAESLMNWARERETRGVETIYPSSIPRSA
ncbi:MAG: NUDIX hydrolase [Woeseiaceae bacterium]|nr:NUDIX hydrolase [Woeseiaceae bacterium]